MRISILIFLYFSFFTFFSIKGDNSPSWVDKNIFDKKAGVMFPQMEELFELEMPFENLLCLYVEKYMELLMPNFYAKHICRIPLDKWPEPMTRSLNKLNQSLYVTMQGPSEFGIGGNLINWDVKKQLPQIKIPTLTIGGKYDTMDPEHMKWMSTQVQNGRYLYCPEGSHMSMYDDQKNYFPGLIQFIKDVDNGNFKGEK